MASRHWEQNKDATVYVGNIDERLTPDMLQETMQQMGRVRQVHMPQDRVTQRHQGYGFVEFDTPESAEYVAKVLNGVRLYGKALRVNKASADKQKAVDIGAELYVGNLDPSVDEKNLYDMFSRFGGILRQPSIARDDHNISKGYGFISFDSFEASDSARETLNNQYFQGRNITVEYAFKKDGRGERHGDEAERKLAAEGKKHNVVPERQVLPAAFHMSTSAANTPTLTTNPQGPPPNVGGSVPLGPRGMNAPVMGNGNVTAPQFSRNNPNTMPLGRGTGMAGRSGLPPAPAGLPARPPPVNNFANAPFRPNPAQVIPPPGFPAPAPGMPALGMSAPPGFPGPSGMSATPGFPGPSGMSAPVGFPGPSGTGMPGAAPPGMPGAQGSVPGLHTAPGLPLPPNPPGFQPPGFGPQR